jgi:hypothetical protein
MTGISEVAQVVFVRKRLVEIQYLPTTISKEHREEFGQLVEDTIRRIESAQFLPHSGILPVLGTLPGKARIGRCRSGAAARSREPWLA